MSLHFNTSLWNLGTTATEALRSEIHSEVGKVLESTQHKTLFLTLQVFKKYFYISF